MDFVFNVFFVFSPSFFPPAGGGSAGQSSPEAAPGDFLNNFSYSYFSLILYIIIVR